MRPTSSRSVASVFLISALSTSALAASVMAEPLSNAPASNAPASIGANSETDFVNPLIVAIEQSDVVQVQQLLSNGASANARDAFGATPLMRATYLGSDDSVRMLLKAGANVNAHDDGGATALHIAVRRDQQDIATLLMNAGADVNAKDKDDWTPLMRASQSGQTDLARVLIERGAKVDVANIWGENPLILASRAKDADSVKMLVASGADPKAKTVDGQSAIAAADEAKKPEIVAMLEQPATITPAEIADVLPETSRTNGDESVVVQAASLMTDSVGNVLNTYRREATTDVAAQQNDAQRTQDALAKMTESESASLTDDMTADDNAAPQQTAEASPVEPVQAAKIVNIPAPSDVRAMVDAQIGASPLQLAQAETTATDARPAKSANSVSYLLQLGAFQSEQAAAQYWSALNTEFPQVFEDLKPFVAKVALGEEGHMVYRTQAGVLTDDADAKSRCATLEHADVPCFVVESAMLGKAAEKAIVPSRASSKPEPAPEPAAQSSLPATLPPVSDAASDTSAPAAELGQGTITRADADTVPTLPTPENATADAKPAAPAPAPETTKKKGWFGNFFSSEDSEQKSPPVDAGTAPTPEMVDAPVIGSGGGAVFGAGAGATAAASTTAKALPPLSDASPAAKSAQPEPAPMPKPAAAPTLPTPPEAERDAAKPVINIPASPNAPAEMGGNAAQAEAETAPVPSVGRVPIEFAAAEPAPVRKTSPAPAKVSAKPVAATLPSTLPPVSESPAPANPYKGLASKPPEAMPTAPQPVAEPVVMGAPPAPLGANVEPPRPAGAPINTGQVEVGEAVRVPLSGSQIAVAPAGTARVQPQAMHTGAPSRFAPLPVWARIGSFASEGDAMAFWRQAQSTAGAAVEGRRMRITRALGSSYARVAIEVGPFNSSQEYAPLCQAAAEAEKSCTSSQEMGVRNYRDPETSRYAGHWTNNASPRGMAGESYMGLLGTFTSREDAEAAWNATASHGSIAGTRHSITAPSYNASGAPALRLQAGPFQGRAAAESFCRQVVQQGGRCVPIKAM